MRDFLTLHPVNTPSPHLVYTNKVYLSPDSIIPEDIYIHVNGLIFQTSYHQSISQSSIGLNKIQRQTLRISAPETVTCKMVDTESLGHVPIYSSIKIECKFLSSVVNDHEIDVVEFISHIKRCYGESILTVDQKFVTEYIGDNILMKVVSGKSRVFVRDVSSISPSTSSVRNIEKHDHESIRPFDTPNRDTNIEDISTINGTPKNPTSFAYIGKDIPHTPNDHHKGIKNNTKSSHTKGAGDDSSRDEACQSTQRTCNGDRMSASTKSTPTLDSLTNMSSASTPILVSSRPSQSSRSSRLSQSSDGISEPFPIDPNICLTPDKSIDVVSGMVTEDTEIELVAISPMIIDMSNDTSKAFKSNSLFIEKFSFEELGIGGLDGQLNNIFRRAFASRIFSPEIMEKMGTKHAKGVILYGPPGTGKTLIARQIGKILNTVEPKIINGPEILNKYVGQSEENIRNLFQDVETEYQEVGDKSKLHLIIFDEIDAICKQRGSSQSSSGVGDSIVNQLLSKIDGIKSLNNLLIIGMTNRLDLLDDALLRPGRFEVQMEIGLPDEAGRAQILKIHTKSMRENNYIEDMDLLSIAQSTKNYSGAELEGVVRSATTFALSRLIPSLDAPTTNIDYSKLKVTKDDISKALEEIKPSLGVSSVDLEPYLEHPMLDFNKGIVASLKDLVDQLERSNRTNSLSLLLSGNLGTRKTTLAAYLSKYSNYPYVKMVSAEKMIGRSDTDICGMMGKIFNDAYRSERSVVILDDIERIIQYTSVGPRFSNTILQTLLVLIRKRPPTGKKILIVGTSSVEPVMRKLGIYDTFNMNIYTPMLTRSQALGVISQMGNGNGKGVIGYDTLIDQGDRRSEWSNSPISFEGDCEVIFSPTSQEANVDWDQQRNSSDIDNPNVEHEINIPDKISIKKLLVLIDIYLTTDSL